LFFHQLDLSVLSPLLSHRSRLLSKAKYLIGQRYVLNGGPYSFQEAVDALRKNFPERQNIIAKGQPGDYSRQSQAFTHDGSKVIRDLGLQYTSFDKVVLDTVSTSSICTNVLDKTIFVLRNKYMQYYTIT
jgi:hypothetical protein